MTTPEPAVPDAPQPTQQKDHGRAGRDLPTAIGSADLADGVFGIEPNTLIFLPTHPRGV